MVPTRSHGQEAAFLVSLLLLFDFFKAGERRQVGVGMRAFSRVLLSTYSALAGCRILRPGPTYRTRLCISHLYARELEKRWPSSPRARAGAHRCSKGEARGHGAHGDWRFKCDLRSLFWVLHPCRSPILLTHGSILLTRFIHFSTYFVWGTYFFTKSIFTGFITRRLQLFVIVLKSSQYI